MAALYKRLARVRDFIAKIKDHVDDEWKGYVLKCRETPQAKAKQGCVTFKNDMVEELLRPFVIAPSKIKKKVAEEMAAEINQKLKQVRDSGFPVG